MHSLIRISPLALFPLCARSPLWDFTIFHHRQADIAHGHADEGTEFQNGHNQCSMSDRATMIDSSCAFFAVDNEDEDMVDTTSADRSPVRRAFHILSFDLP